eukprot:7281056-Pyramimonas_sp.AAC.1
MLDRTGPFYAFTLAKGKIAVDALSISRSTLGRCVIAEFTSPRSIFNAIDALVDGALGAGRAYTIDVFGG